MLRACGYLGGVVTRLAEANSRCCSPSSPLNVAATLAAAKTKGSHSTLFTTPLPVRVPSASIFNTTTTADTESAQKEGVQHRARKSFFPSFIYLFILFLLSSFGVVSINYHSNPPVHCKKQFRRLTKRTLLPPPSISPLSLSL